jgi:hypothetical protein
VLDSVGLGWNTITVGWMDEYLLAQAGVFFVIWKGVRALARIFSGPLGYVWSFFCFCTLAATYRTPNEDHLKTNIFAVPSFSHVAHSRRWMYLWVPSRRGRGRRSYLGEGWFIIDALLERQRIFCRHYMFVGTQRCL